jgi:hypothetical protein
MVGVNKGTGGGGGGTLSPIALMLLGIIAMIVLLFGNNASQLIREGE